MLNTKIKVYSLLIMSAIIFTCITLIPSYAAETELMESSPKYLIILVHGKSSNSGIFEGKRESIFWGAVTMPPHEGDYGNLKKYLEDDLGLKGYVYAYNFSNSEMDIKHQGWELGDRNYSNPASGMNGKCWLDKAREDFIARFTSKEGLI